MAVDEGLLSLQRDDLAEQPGIVEKKMFGGVAFMRHGHMVCGVHARAAMYRVGKPAQARALALPGVAQMAFTGRPMGGFVEAGPEAMADDALRRQLLQMALEHVQGLPPK